MPLRLPRKYSSARKTGRCIRHYVGILVPALFGEGSNPGEVFDPIGPAAQMHFG